MVLIPNLTLLVILKVFVLSNPQVHQMELIFISTHKIYMHVLFVSVCVPQSEIQGSQHTEEEKPQRLSDPKSSCQCRRPWVHLIPGSGISHRKGVQPTQYYFPQISSMDRGLESYGPWDHKESDMATNCFEENSSK